MWLEMGAQIVVSFATKLAVLGIKNENAFPREGRKIRPPAASYQALSQHGISIGTISGATNSHALLALCEVYRS